MKKEFLVVFELGQTSLGAFAPDIPGCFAVGKTLDETRQRYLEAVEAHLKWLANDHDPVPEPVTSTYDFAPRDGAVKTSYYVEWLTVPIPAEVLHAIPA
ncbi:MAG TPA: type II toxin-antitoxin system HicB family antitoxin [Terracidiphilus sp.]|jgi:predicted RNase H-like HicB family nuclease|nr:type II toxin-antitoxin system HicB family antitoxin [Terracidiphilus sp.]